MEAGAEHVTVREGGGAVDYGSAMFVEAVRRRPYDVLKRSTDIVLAVALIVICSPVFCVLALLIMLDSGRPVLYSQQRIGRHGRAFSIWKLRTMVSSCDEVHTIGTTVGLPKLEVDPRATRLGRSLRIWSLDELPQLWNVLRGDMSLVGPRPLQRFEVESLPPWLSAVRQSVLPGMTGTWQVSGRSSLDWDDRIALDCDYANRASSTILDLKVLIGTIPAVLRRDGAR